MNEDNQPAIDRARATALNVILKATGELRRLQTSRNIAIGIFPEAVNLSDLGIANQKEMISALTANGRRLTFQSKLENGDQLAVPAAAPAPQPAASPAPDRSFL